MNKEKKWIMMSLNTYAISNKSRYAEWVNLNKGYRSMLKKNNRVSLTPNKIPKNANFDFNIKYLRDDMMKNRLIVCFGNIYGYNLRGTSVDKCGAAVAAYRLRSRPKMLVAIHILYHASIYDKKG